jgi:hypothetical protein
MEERPAERDGWIRVEIYPWKGYPHAKAFQVEKNWRLRDFRYEEAGVSVLANRTLNREEMADLIAAAERALEIAAELDALHPEGSEYTV